ncbi:hypothetical protein BU23DRAFT_554697 [Bimuria novae-zelandiae CBS 107.79]|uniref:PiggyBac transposable element-derived protein domain-containing protein n=1 Tax=Bimuria novae-zelandiae CBS 107.79 TaxID=1447943 RepID=A0A6A5VA24_9PLEO|nr:hypothetical protein BU23DRAFT_554697 [Bimuria novae-zelandiae CBS 107.79]
MPNPASIVSNNPDFVKYTKYSQKRGVLPNLPSTPPPQWRPLKINNLRTFGVADLPKGTDRGSPIALFNLFFDAEVMEQIAHFTNDRAAYAHPQLPSARGWKPTSPGELYTYFAIVVYMAVHREPSLAEYWSRGHKNAPTHKLNDFMGCTRWHQLDRYLYTAEAFTPTELVPVALVLAVDANKTFKDAARVELQAKDVSVKGRARQKVAKERFSSSLMRLKTQFTKHMEWGEIR